MKMDLGKGHGDDLESAIYCLRCWDSDVRIIGNVRVRTLLELLEEIERLRIENAAYKRAYPRLSGKTGPP